MPQGELTGQRPNNYSRWHRSKDRGSFIGSPGPSPACFMCDGDWFEQRDRAGNGNLVVIAYIETIQTENLGRVEEYPVFPSKEKLGIEISARMHIPFFVVYHNAACTEFVVKSYRADRWRRFNQRQYIEFLEGL